MKIKNIAIVAHDSRKNEMLEWVKLNADRLSRYFIIATASTAKLIKSMHYTIVTPKVDGEETVYPFKEKVIPMLSGPLGGDQQIGAMIAQGNIDALIFFCDNLIVQGHQNDVSALSRLASLYNIPFAENRTTADMILTSSLIDNDEYEPKKPNFTKYLNRLNVK